MELIQTVVLGFFISIIVTPLVGDQILNFLAQIGIGGYYQYKALSLNDSGVNF